MSHAGTKSMQTKKSKRKKKGVTRVGSGTLVSQPDIRHLARANGAMVEASRNRNGETPEGLEMAAFMAVFHPNITGKKLKALVG